MKKIGLILCGIFWILIGCASDQETNTEETNTEETNVEEISTSEAENSLQWYMRLPIADETLAESIKTTRELRINELLQVDGAGYQVEIHFLNDFESIESDLNFTIPREDEALQMLNSLQEEEQAVDVIQTNSGSFHGDMMLYPATYSSAVNSGLLEPLDAYLASEQGLTLQDNMSESWVESREINGNIYGVGGGIMIYSGKAYHMESLKKAGVDPEEISSNFLENQAVFARMVEELEGPIWQFSSWALYDPYESDTIGLGFSYKIENEEIVPGIQTQKFRDDYATFYQWKQEGIISMGELADPVIKDVMQVNSTEPYEITDEVTGELWYVIPEMETGNSVKVHDTIIGVASWSEKKDYAFDFISRLYGDEKYANAMQFGEEGVNYKREGNLITEYDFESMIFESYTNDLLTYSRASDPEDKVEWQEEVEENAMKNEMFYVDPTEIQTEILNVYDIWANPIFPQTFSSEMQKVLKMEEEEWERVLEDTLVEMKDAGMDVVLEELNRQYQAHLSQ